MGSSFLRDPDGMLEGVRFLIILREDKINISFYWTQRALRVKVKYGGHLDL
jgi:hypothetical protein